VVGGRDRDLLGARHGSPGSWVVVSRRCHGGRRRRGHDIARPFLVGEGGGREDGKKLRAPGARPAMRRQFAIRRLPRAMPPSAIPWLARATPKRGDRLGRLV
jgi:hypothetical protein